MMNIQIIFTLFALNMSHIHPKKMWNQMEINWYLVTLFLMQYINILDGINHNFMSSHIKIKSVTVSMNAVAIPNIDVKVWARKSELLQWNLLPSLTQPKITRQRPLEVTYI